MCIEKPEHMIYYTLHNHSLKQEVKVEDTVRI